MPDLKVKMDLTGLDELYKAIDNAKKAMSILDSAIYEVSRTLHHVGLKIEQPPE